MDKITFKILKLFYYSTEILSVDNISAISEYDVQTVSASCLYLRNNGYIHTKDPTQTDADTIHPDSFYSITLEGRATLQDHFAKKKTEIRNLIIAISTLVLSAITAVASVIAALK